jgi:hypothetical protein
MHENGAVTGQEPNQLRTLQLTIIQHQILVTSNITNPVALKVLITANNLTLIKSEITPPSLLGIARKIA